MKEVGIPEALRCPGNFSTHGRDLGGGGRQAEKGFAGRGGLEGRGVETEGGDGLSCRVEGRSILGWLGEYERWEGRGKRDLTRCAPGWGRGRNV